VLPRLVASAASLAGSSKLCRFGRVPSVDCRVPGFDAVVLSQKPVAGSRQLVFPLPLPLLLPLLWLSADCRPLIAGFFRRGPVAGSLAFALS